MLPKYAFDMITGATHTPAATTMKEFLDHVDGKEFAMCYVEKKNTETGNWAVEPTDYQTLKQNLGIDPFLITENDTHNLYADRLHNEFRFVFGFKATMNKGAFGSKTGLSYNLRWLYPSKQNTALYENASIEQFLNPEN